jgi:subtilisin family serine protease
MKRFIRFTLLTALLIAILGVSSVSLAASPRTYIIMSKVGGLAAQGIAQAKAAGGVVTSNFPQISAAVVTSSNPNFAARLRAAGYIVAPNRRFPISKPERLVRESSKPDAAGGATNTLFPLQWSLQAVRAVEGWQAGRRGQGAQVAVLDEGFYLNHPDLAANFNTALARSFVPGETVQWTLENGFSHGTHVSGIIAAVDNDTGTVGVAPQAQIIPVKVLSEQLGYGEDQWVLSGMIYAGYIHADIINMSLGGTCERADPDCVAIKQVYDAVSKWVRQQGTTIIASAGNDAIDYDAHPELIDLPAMADGILGVTATGPLGWAVYPDADPRRPASYSNFGKVIADFAAPGGDFAYPGNENCTVAGRTRPCWVYDMVISPAEVDAGEAFYYFAAGTSMAAPHLSGIAAQFVGAYGGSMSPALLEKALAYVAEPLSPKAFYGKGFARANK